MPVSTPSLATGSPQFGDARLASIASRDGALAAWRVAIESNAKPAFTGITGDFAIGFREPGGRSFIAVDRFGIQSLCSRIDNGILSFASRADE